MMLILQVFDYWTQYIIHVFYDVYIQIIISSIKELKQILIIIEPQIRGDVVANSTDVL